jgi:hypothetical protein
MSKVVRDITTSLDGFMADPNDDVERLHDWLFSGNTPSAYNDFGSGWLRGKAVGPEKRERLGEGAALPKSPPLHPRTNMSRYFTWRLTVATARPRKMSLCL